VSKSQSERAAEEKSPWPWKNQPQLSRRWPVTVRVFLTKEAVIIAAIQIWTSFVAAYSPCSYLKTVASVRNLRTGYVLVSQ
jgi:hypothetical protein